MNRLYLVCLGFIVFGLLFRDSGCYYPPQYGKSGTPRKGQSPGGDKLDYFAITKTVMNVHKQMLGEAQKSVMLNVGGWINVKEEEYNPFARLKKEKKKMKVKEEKKKRMTTPQTTKEWIEFQKEEELEMEREWRRLYENMNSEFNQHDQQNNQFNQRDQQNNQFNQHDQQNNQFNQRDQQNNQLFEQFQKSGIDSNVEREFNPMKRSTPGPSSCYSHSISFTPPAGKVPWARHVSYVQTNYFCNDTQVDQARYNTLRNDPFTFCNSTSFPTRACLCAEDRWGSRCTNKRPIQCDVIRVSPTDDCIMPEDSEPQGGVALNGDFNCVRFTTKDTATFAFTLNCSFSAPANYDTYNLLVNRDANFTDLATGKNMTWDEIQDGFAYKVLSPYRLGNGHIKFAKTETFTESFVLRPINFYDLSQTDNDIDISLPDPPMYYGQQTFQANVKFSDLPDQYRTANRLYFEGGIRRLDGRNLKRFHRMHIDFEDLSEPGYVDKQAIILAATLTPSLTILVCCFGIIFTFCMIRRYRRKNEIKSR